MKTILLARVSTREQEEGLSIDSQMRRLLEYAERKGLANPEQIAITESSTKETRTKFEQIIETIKKSKEPVVLIADTIDRVQRSWKESVILDAFRREGKVEIHFFRENLIINKDSNSSDILRWDMGVMFARSYVLQLSDNVKRSTEQKLRKGEWPGKAPIGYINTVDEHENKIIAPDPTRAHLIKKVFEIYSTGRQSIRMIANEMRKAALTNNSLSRKPVSQSQIDWIIKNPFYYGEMLYNDKIYPHRYEPLVTRHLWQKCQDVAHNWGKKPFQYAALPFIFRGIIKCGICGCTITPEIKKGKYVYYSCTNYRQKHQKVYVKENELLKPIYEVFEGLRIPEDKLEELTAKLKKIHEHESVFHQQSMDALKREYDLIEARISRMYDDKLDGRITQDIYDKKLKEYKEKQTDLLLQMEEHSNADQDFYLNASRVLDLANRALEVFESSETTEKRALLNFLLQNPVLEGKNLVFTLKSPFDSIVECSQTQDWLRW